MFGKMFNETDGSSPRLIFNQTVQICIKVLETGSYSSNKKELRVWLRIPILESWKGISVNTHLLIKSVLQFTLFFQIQNFPQI